jgi:hypothetical protein
MAIQSELVAQDVRCDCRCKTKNNYDWSSKILPESKKAIEEQQQRAGVESVDRPFSIRQTNQQQRFG